MAPGAPWGRAALPALTALVLLLICLVFTFVMAAWHRDVGRVLGASGESVAAAVAGEVDRNIELLDFSLRGIVEQWDMPEVQALSPRLRDRVLFDSALRAPGFGMVMVLDRDGLLVAQSAELGGLGASFADRDYFRVHANNGDVGLYVSKPVRSRISGAWIVALSRRIDDDAGRFGGVAVGTIDIAYLGRLYAALGIGDGPGIGESTGQGSGQGSGSGSGSGIAPGDAATLFRTDGTVIIREPYVEKDVRLFAGGNDSFDRMRASRAGAFEGPSPIDGRPRIISFHRVGDLPLIQAVEVAGEGDYAAWWRRAAAIAGLLTLLCLGVLGLSLALARELGRRAAAEAELRRLASTDALTGLANRRRFDAALAEGWAAAAAAGEPLALLMVDADSFKSYNDTFGHPAGDGVLRAVAERLDAGARARGGLAARCGGEEFAVLLPACGEARALRLAEGLRAAVEALAIPHPSGVAGVVTVSVGVAAARPAAGGTRGSGVGPRATSWPRPTPRSTGPRRKGATAAARGRRGRPGERGRRDSAAHAWNTTSAVLATSWSLVMPLSSNVSSVPRSGARARRRGVGDEQAGRRVPRRVQHAGQSAGRVRAVVRALEAQEVVVRPVHPEQAHHVPPEAGVEHEGAARLAAVGERVEEGGRDSLARGRAARPSATRPA